MKRPVQSYMFWVFLAFMSIGVFYPAIGLIAIICMVAPVVAAF